MGSEKDGLLTTSCLVNNEECTWASTTCFDDATQILVVWGSGLFFVVTIANTASSLPEVVAIAVVTKAEGTD
uniref:Uncharacterized protein n=1 Tax=Fagus sylvatica TaxID=28930 RepID=A0A2N9F847_FAGSY